MEKRILGQIEKCYACLGAVIDGEPWLFFAGEGKGILKAFHGEDFAREEVIWEGGGGTMSIVARPDDPRSFLVSRGFYSLVEAGPSAIESVQITSQGITHRPVAYLPWLHRFDVVAGADGTLYIVAATLAESKTAKEDWSKPGHIYYAELDGAYPLTMHQLPGDYFQNHGFCRVGNLVYIGTREGGFRVTPPGRRGDRWSIEQVMDFPVSDLAVCDIDGDGRQEIACITPFHGDRYKVYRDGREIYAYPVENDFYHMVISGQIAGKRVFCGGARQKTASLFSLVWDQGGICADELDRGCGPSNAHILNTPQRDILLVANRQIGEAAVYLFDRE